MSSLCDNCATVGCIFQVGVEREKCAFYKNKNDVIKRQDVIDAWDKLSKRGRTEFDQVLMTLPSAEPKTGEWVLDPNGMDWNIPAWRCSECGFVANYIGVEANGLGNNPLNWAGSKFCPQCGARITGYER